MQRVALVTGASRGIGQGIARHFYQEGYVVIGCSRRGKADLEWECLPCDVTDAGQVSDLVHYIIDEYCRLDIVVNCAGIAGMNAAVLMPVEQARRIVDVNLIGTFIICREVAKAMREVGGRIINITSVAVPLALEGEAIYSASKAGVEQLTRALAREFAPWKITVNAIGPGPVKTGLIGGVPPEKLDALLERLALYQFCTIEDVVNVVDFFARPESGVVTGQVLYLGGP